MSALNRFLSAAENLEAGAKAFRDYWERANAAMVVRDRGETFVHEYWRIMRDNAELELMSKKKELGFSVDDAMATIMSQLTAAVTPAKEEP